MPNCSKNSLYRWLLLCFLLMSGGVACAGNPYATQIERAEISLSGDQVLLNADIHYHLSPVAEAALQHGIALNFEVLLQIRETGGLWNNTIKNISIPYRLRYMTMLNLYRINNHNGSYIGHFATLDGALRDLGSIVNIFVAKRSDIESQHQYQAALKVLFDVEALPLPLRPEAYFKKEWYLSSSWRQWHLPRLPE